MQTHHAQPVALATAPVQPAAVSVPEANLAKDINKEYHDPLDDWSSRDTLLSFLPFISIFAFKDSALGTALSFAIALQGFLLLMRLAFWDSNRKKIWPDIEITGIVGFAILRGLYRHWPGQIHKWITVILPLGFIAMALLSIIIRRAFTGHYARYPKFDKGGRGLWERDASYRKTADLTAIFWVVAWSVSLLLSLIPILTNNWAGYNALNIIFNYVVPFFLMALALIFQQFAGRIYCRKATNIAQTTLPAEGAYPAGHHHHQHAGVPPTYSTAA